MLACFRQLEAGGHATAGTHRAAAAQDKSKQPGTAILPATKTLQLLLMA